MAIFIIRMGRGRREDKRYSGGLESGYQP